MPNDIYQFSTGQPLGGGFNWNGPDVTAGGYGDGTGSVGMPTQAVGRWGVPSGIPYGQAYTPYNPAMQQLMSQGVGSFAGTNPLAGVPGMLRPGTQPTGTSFKIGAGLTNAQRIAIRRAGMQGQTGQFFTAHPMLAQQVGRAYGRVVGRGGNVNVANQAFGQGFDPTAPSPFATAMQRSMQAPARYRAPLGRMVSPQGPTVGQEVM